MVCLCQHQNSAMTRTRICVKDVYAWSQPAICLFADVSTITVAQEPRWYEIAVMAGITLSDVNAPPKEWNSYLFPGQVPFYTM